MQVHYGIQNLPAFKNAVVTIGTFDGVHTGHQQIISQLKKEAAEVGGETVIITFHPHPRKIISSEKVFVLNTLAEKIELLASKQIEHLAVIPFNESFAQQSAEEYIKNFLVEKFHPHTIIIGYDHHFGKNREGDYHLLENFGKALGFGVKEISKHLLHEVTVSSTKIREALLAGDIITANEYLGYDYFFEGIVETGNRLGTALGYPTANLKAEDGDKLIPGNGVYAVMTCMVNRQSLSVNRESSIVNRESSMMKDDSIMKINHESIETSRSPLINHQSQLLKGMMNIGVRPTIDGKKRMIEVNIFDFDNNIYGETLRVYLKKYLRPELKFNGLEELTAQLHKDKLAALEALS